MIFIVIALAFVAGLMLGAALFLFFFVKTLLEHL